MSLFHWVFLVFLILRLCHVITWSWWWVTSPIWGLFLVTLVVAVRKATKKPTASDAVKDALRALRRQG